MLEKSRRANLRPAFQTQASAENFARVAKRYTAAEGTERELSFEGRTIQVRACPISIATGFGVVAGNSRSSWVMCVLRR